MTLPDPELERLARIENNLLHQLAVLPNMVDDLRTLMAAPASLQIAEELETFTLKLQGIVGEVHTLRGRLGAQVAPLDLRPLPECESPPAPGRSEGSAEPPPH